MRNHAGNIALKKWGTAVLAVALSACLVLAVSGCKYTDVLTEHIEDPESENINENVDPLYEEVPGAPQNPDLVNAVVADADDLDTQTEALPHYDANAGNNGLTPAQQHSESTPHEEEATEGEEESSSDSSTQGTGNSDGSNTGDSELSSETSEDALGDTSGEGGIGEEEVVVDSQGTTEPSETGNIAACGQYATITQMLGGAGALVAADDSWISYCTSKGVFPNELSGVQTAWSTASDGTVTCNVDVLINNAKPSVVLYDGTNLTDSDQAQLTAAGITVTPVPSLGEVDTTDASICQAVSQVGSILSGAQGIAETATDRANKYLEYRASVLQSTMTSAGGYAYKYIDGSSYGLYQDDTSYLTKYFTPQAASGTTPVSVAFVYAMQSIGSSKVVNQSANAGNVKIYLGHNEGTLDTSDGMAISAFSSSNSFILLDYYLQFAGIVDNAYDTDKPSEKKPYPILAGSIDDGTGTGNVYGHRSTSADSALWYPVSDSSVASNWVSLGSSNGLFPALLTKDEATAQAIRTSRDKENGLYNMKDSSGQTLAYCVYSLPSGVSGSWAEGNVESFLAAPWALRVRTDGEQVLKSDGIAYKSTKEFYEYFYRCDNFESVVENFYSTEE